MIEENFGLTNIMKMIYTKESIEGFSLLQKHGFYISSISGNPCMQGTDGFQVWHISSGCKFTSNLEHPLSRS